jgi:aspartate/methionine/tyrosine aminotransferase
MWRLNDLFGVIPAHTAEQLSVVALANLDRISNRARVLLERNRALLKDFFGSRTDLDVVLPEHGTIALPRLKAGQVDSFCASLRERYDVTVVPGRFFDAPECFRIGIGCSTEMLAGGLERLSAALDELA